MSGTRIEKHGYAKIANSIKSIFMCSFAIHLIIITSCKQYPEGWFTPEQFKYKVTIAQSSYKTDSIQILSKVYEYLLQKKDPFDSNEFNKMTQLKIDTIIYSPNRAQAAFFIVSTYLFKNYRSYKEDQLLSISDKTLSSAHCFMAKKKTNDWSIYSFDLLNPANYSDSKELSERIREMYFHELGTLNVDNCRYNFDDIRMWKEAVWNKF
jgi:hypothetical protein